VVSDGRQHLLSPPTHRLFVGSVMIIRNLNYDGSQISINCLITLYFIVIVYLSLGSVFIILSFGETTNLSHAVVDREGEEII
jgi:hypothetical protein